MFEYPLLVRAAKHPGRESANRPKAADELELVSRTASDPKRTFVIRYGSIRFAALFSTVRSLHEGARMAVALLLTIGSITIGVLGLVHLLYTFRSNKFEPQDEKLGLRLREVSPVLTSETTMWKAWVGFNASHSLGAILFAAVFGYLAMLELDFLLSSPFLVSLSLVTLGCYLVLARSFWFKVPFLGVSVSMALFAIGYLLAYV